MQLSVNCEYPYFSLPTVNSMIPITITHLMCFQLSFPYYLFHTWSPLSNCVQERKTYHLLTGITLNSGQKISSGPSMLPRVHSMFLLFIYFVQTLAETFFTFSILFSNSSPNFFPGDDPSTNFPDKTEATKRDLPKTLKIYSTDLLESLLIYAASLMVL